jgi:AcrR family transcriptional regulator
MSIRGAELPIWLRPEPGNRKPRFTREAIAKVALAIADTDGFEAVSMRRIAEELGSGTMTLYHYVRTKAELVALMDDALMGEILLPEGTLPNGWREALAAIAGRTREVFRRHPWALLSMQGAVPGPNSARHFEQCLAALSRTSFDRRTKLELLALVDDFVFGHALRTAEARSALQKEPDAEVLAAIRTWASRQYETGAFPHTFAFFGRAPAEKVVAEVAGVHDEEGRFQRGLTTLLEGVTRNHPRPKRVRRATATRRR